MLYKPPKNCPLCPPNISRDEHDDIWRATQHGGYDEAIRLFREQFDADLSFSGARAHFEYHRPRQAYPKKRLKRAQALELAASVTDRKRSVLDLCFRVPGLSGRDIGRALYWTGAPDKLVAAEKAALRDLRRMMRDDLIFRCYLDNLPGPGVRPDDISGLYFLGANGRAYVEDLHTLTVNRKDWIEKDADFKSWTDVHARHSAHQAISTLQEQLPGSMSGRFTTLSDGSTLSWDIRNWIDGRHLQMTRFHDPMTGAGKLKVDGMAALGIRTPTSSLPHLLPFVYYHEDSSRRLERLLDDMHAQCAISRSPEFSGLFPDFNKHLPLPGFVIAGSSRRAQRILDRSLALSANKTGTPPPAFACDELTAANASIEERVWTPMFRRSASPVSLIGALWEAHGSAPPIRSSFLRWHR